MKTLQLAIVYTEEVDFWARLRQQSRPFRLELGTRDRDGVAYINRVTYVLRKRPKRYSYL